MGELPRRGMSTGRPACGPGEEIRAVQAGPTVVRMMLGGRLGGPREANGMTPADAGWAIRGSHSKINRMEMGRSGFKRRDVARSRPDGGCRDWRSVGVLVE